MAAKFRALRADEVEVRVSQIGPYSTQLLLYKDARCDMNILDEGVGPDNWQRKHTRDNANCIVSIWDESKKQWIEKEDTGTESYTEKEKGLASDSFKRACFNWGIGRELYTAGRISVPNNKLEIIEKNGKKALKDTLDVTAMDVENGAITRLIISKGDGSVVFSKHQNAAVSQTPPTDQVILMCASCKRAIAATKTRTAQQVAESTKQRYGRMLCSACANREQRELDAIAAEVHGDAGDRA